MLLFIPCIILLCILPLCMEPMLLDDDAGVIAPESCAYTAVTDMQRPSAIDAAMAFAEKLMMTLHLMRQSDPAPIGCGCATGEACPRRRVQPVQIALTIRALFRGLPHRASRRPVYTCRTRLP
jgi:hypothetical protein